MHWRNQDFEALDKLHRLWPELKITPGTRTATAEFPSGKAMKEFLLFVGLDEDLRPRMTPLRQGETNTKPSKWWYTLDITWEREGPILKFRISIPPSDLAAIVRLLEPS